MVTDEQHSNPQVPAPDVSLPQNPEMNLSAIEVLKPDPNSAPRRGRGRPPKPKTPLTTGVVSSPPRPRGRPPKSRDSTSLPPPPTKSETTVVSTATVTGRKRGRPPKAVTGGVTSAPPGGGVASTRGRGRPPKVKPAVVAAPVGA